MKNVLCNNTITDVQDRYYSNHKSDNFLKELYINKLAMKLLQFF